MQNTIKLYKNNLIFSYEKENKIKRIINNSIGIDIGYKKLLSTSTKNFYGKELLNVYYKLSRQRHGSKNFKQTLIERDKLVNRFCNELNKKEVFDEIVIEDLKNVKYKSKIGHKFMNKLQR